MTTCTNTDHGCTKTLIVYNPTKTKQLHEVDVTSWSGLKIEEYIENFLNHVDDVIISIVTCHTDMVHEKTIDKDDLQPTLKPEYPVGDVNVPAGSKGKIRRTGQEVVCVRDMLSTDSVAYVVATVSATSEIPVVECTRRSDVLWFNKPVRSAGELRRVESTIVVQELENTNAIHVIKPNGDIHSTTLVGDVERINYPCIVIG